MQGKVGFLLDFILCSHTGVGFVKAGAGMTPEVYLESRLYL